MGGILLSNRATLTVIAACVVGLAAACSSATPAVSSPAAAPAGSTPAAASLAPSTAAAAPSPTCDPSKEPDVIVRYTVPGLEDSAQELGGWDLETCQVDIDKIMSTMPTGDGYCAQIAWKSDNPTYNVDATPAPPLRKVIEAIGAGC